MIRYSKYLVMVVAIFVCVLNIQAQLLKVGSKVPEFKLLDQNGKEFDIKNVLGKEKLVIYFYPKDETSGCTKEACAFRDNSNSFTQKDAIIIGISGQSIASHKEFAEHHELPFTLLSDKDNKVRKLFGVSNGLVPGRVTFVVDKSGTIIYCYESLTQPLRHVELSLKAVGNNNALSSDKK